MRTEPIQRKPNVCEWRGDEGDVHYICATDVNGREAQFTQNVNRESRQLTSSERGRSLDWCDGSCVYYAVLNLSFVEGFGIHLHAHTSYVPILSGEFC